MIDFREELRTVHKPLTLLPEALPGEVLLPGRVRIGGGRGNEILEKAAEDLRAFLTGAGVCAELGEQDAFFSLRVDPGLSPGAYALEVSEGGCRITGHAFREVAQGVYRLEYELRERRARSLPPGKRRFEMPFSPRMVHSAYGLDDYPDEYLSLLAHEGYDAILVFVKGPNQSAGGALDFNGLVRRAAGYGIDVYGYCYIQNFTHPAEDGAAERYDALYGSVFRECPGLKGMVFVGESVEFPSRDSRVAKRRYFELPADNIPEDKPTPGWWPCNDYPEWISLVRDSIRRYRKDADVVFWTYNFGWAPEADRLALIERLPRDISLLVTFEMFENYRTGGVWERVSDYSIAYAPAGSYFESEAKAAKRRGIRLYAMTNTAGRTWDFGTVPYLPTPFQWMERCKAVNAARTDYGLCGLMESHHYGAYPSFISKLCGLCFASGDFEENLRSVLRAEFGTAESALLEGLKSWSEAIRLLPPTIEEQYGPCRVGPAYPLCLIAAVSPPEEPGAYYGNKIWSPVYGQFEGGLTLGFGDKGTPYALRQNAEIRMLRRAVSLMKLGVCEIAGVRTRGEALERLLNLGRYLECCFRTVLHVKLFYRCKTALKLPQNDRRLKRTALRIRKIALAEIENAKACIPLLEQDSALGFEPTMLCAGGKERVLWKIRQVEYMLASELPYYMGK